MKNHFLFILCLLFLCTSCNDDDDPITPAPGETTGPQYIENLDFSASINETSEIQDFDVENGFLYFIYDQAIYSIDLNSGTNTAELVIEDSTDWPNTLKVIGSTLYYQGDSWAQSQDIKVVDLNNVSAGVQSTHSIVGISRSQLSKDSGKLYYTSSIDAYSPINNFYEFSQSSPDRLIATDDFIHPANMRVIDNYLYFSSKNEVRRFDLSSSTEESVLLYTVPGTGDDNEYEDIIGFDIKDDVVYFTQLGDNKLYAKDLQQPDEAAVVLRSNNDEGVTGYGKIIVADDKLYVKKIIEKQLEIFGI
ncbi:hypothetical protein FUA23_08645 [Neolewinella aurantiaca]|uniref:DUF5050 domain-containing protein n=1 Tax=Neolewinella aurantiaca TaxID=2602767 RepID=A0A5C7FU04_9BACT|nr:hypothetical protein [Neolewinella aurantiaca]TXF90009.1 hypothetical protein FUA23_08645 [Neolewinella aurantiaca]